MASRFSKSLLADPKLADIAPLPYSRRADLEFLAHQLAQTDVELVDDPTMLVAMLVKLDQTPGEDAMEMAERIYGYVCTVFPKQRRTVDRSRAAGKLEGRLRLDAEARSTGYGKARVN